MGSITTVITQFKKILKLGETIIFEFLRNPGELIISFLRECEILPIFSHANEHLSSTVPPSVPMCGIPSSVTTGSRVVLTCKDKDGSPPSSYKWYKNGTPMPEDPSKFSNFKNSTYSIHPQLGHLVSIHAVVHLAYFEMIFFEVECWGLGSGMYHPPPSVFNLAEILLPHRLLHLKLRCPAPLHIKLSPPSLVEC